MAGIQIIAGGQLDWSSQPQTAGKILLAALKVQYLTGYSINGCSAARRKATSLLIRPGGEKTNKQTSLNSASFYVLIYLLVMCIRLPVYENIKPTFRCQHPEIRG